MISRVEQVLNRLHSEIPGSTNSLSHQEIGWLMSLAYGEGLYVMIFFELTS